MDTVIHTTHPAQRWGRTIFPSPNSSYTIIN